MPTQPPSASSSKIVDPRAPRPDKEAWFGSFPSHFAEWVFGPIERLMRGDDALVSFILMSCAIDYLAGFWWGRSTKRESAEAYTAFVRTYFPSNRYDPDGVYDSLRNGLVHMFTIKDRRYALTHNRPDLHLVKDRKNQVVLNASDFYSDLKAAANMYFNDVATTPDLLDKAYERYSSDGFLDVSELSLR